jgi:perosamine synthetase
MSETLKKYIPISLPDTGEDEWLATKDSIMSGWLTAGPKVREFEVNFAKLHQVKYAMAVTSATTALHLALVAIGVKPGDEVIVPAFTWISTANVVLYCGAKVVFVDVDRKTFNLDVNDLQSKITDRTKAIIPVHLFGLCADIDEIKKIVKDIPIIEDGACAAGAAYKGRPAGSLGTIGCFSFHPRKSITTGEGGMITTNDDKLAELLSSLRNHGASISEEERHNGSKPYILPHFNLLGFNYRMTDLQASVGIVQLSKLTKYIDERNKWASYYSNAFKDIDWIITPSYNENYKHGWQSYVLYIDESKSPLTRNQLMEKLQDLGVSTRPGTHAPHMLHFYAEKYNLKPDDFPGAKDCNNYSMSIPLFNKMKIEDYEYVVNAIKSFI